MILKVKDWLKKRTHVKKLMALGRSIRELQGLTDFSDFPRLENQAFGFSQEQLDFAEIQLLNNFAREWEKYSAKKAGLC